MQQTVWRRGAIGVGLVGRHLWQPRGAAAKGMETLYRFSDFSGSNLNGERMISKGKFIGLLSEEEETLRHQEILKSLSGAAGVGSSPSLDVFKGQVHIVKSFEEEEVAMSSLLSDYDSSIAPCSNEGDIRLIGFDTETKPAMYGRPHPISVVQVASRNHAVIYQLLSKDILYEGRLPPHLESLLADPKVVKLGVGIDDDAKNLMFQYGVSIRGVLELNRLGAKKKKHNMLGLGTLCERYLGKSVLKTKDVTCSNWERDTLTELQQIYAAGDAYLGLEIYLKMLAEQPEQNRRVQLKDRVDFICDPNGLKARNGGSLYCRRSLEGKHMKETRAHLSPTLKTKTTSLKHVQLYTASIINFANNADEDMLFLPSFLPATLRKELHALALSLGLQSRSYGSREKRRKAEWDKKKKKYKDMKGTRYMIISKKNVDHEEALQQSYNGE